MAILKSKYKYMLDVAGTTTLIARDGVAKTATFQSSIYELDQLNGYWNTLDELADQTLAVVINVEDVTVNTPTATATLDTVVATDAITIDDGENTAVTFTAVDAAPTAIQFLVGGDDDETAANLADAINATAALTVVATASGAVVTITNPVGFLADAEVSSPDSTITVVDFAGGDETYSIVVECGPVAFGTDVNLGTIPVTSVAQYVFPIDIDTMRLINPDADALRLNCTLAGDSPSITLNSWIAQIIR